MRIKTFGGWKINNKILRDTLHGPLGIGKGQTNPYGQCRGNFDRQHATQLECSSQQSCNVAATIRFENFITKSCGFQNIQSLANHNLRL